MKINNNTSYSDIVKLSNDLIKEENRMELFQHLKDLKTFHFILAHLEMNKNRMELYYKESESQSNSVYFLGKYDALCEVLKVAKILGLEL